MSLLKSRVLNVLQTIGIIIIAWLVYFALPSPWNDIGSLSIVFGVIVYDRIRVIRGRRRVRAVDEYLRQYQRRGRRCGDRW